MSDHSIPGCTRAVAVEALGRDRELGAWGVALYDMLNNRQMDFTTDDPFPLEKYHDPVALGLTQTDVGAWT